MSRNTPVITITCDKCYAELQVELVYFSGYGWREDDSVEATIARHKWVNLLSWKDETLKDYCSKCRLTEV